MNLCNQIFEILRKTKYLHCQQKTIIRFSCHDAAFKNSTLWFLLRFSIKDFFSKWDQICWKLLIWSHLLNQSFMKKFFFINFFITFNQLYKTNSKVKHKKHKTIYNLYTRLYLVIYFSLTYKFARYHRWNRQKQPSKVFCKKDAPKNPTKPTGINIHVTASPSTKLQARDQ